MDRGREIDESVRWLATDGENVEAIISTIPDLGMNAVGIARTSPAGKPRKSRISRKLNWN